MLFIYVLSLFYLTQFVSSQTVSEGEAINKIISDIVLKAEKKNAEPIQFCWKNTITADGQLSTPSSNEIGSQMQRELLDLQPEPLSMKEPQKTSVTSSILRLQDIIPEYGVPDLQPIRPTIKKFKDNEDKATNKDTSKTEPRKRNHLSKTKTHYKQFSISTPRTNKLTSTTFSTSNEQFKESPDITTTDATKLKDSLIPLSISSAEAAEDIFTNEFKNKDSNIKTHKDDNVKIHKDNNVKIHMDNNVKSHKDNNVKIHKHNKVKSHKDNNAKIYKNKGSYDNHGRNTFKNIYHRGKQKSTSKSSRLTASTQLAELSNIENAVNSVPNYEAVTTESMEELLKRISKHKDETGIDERNEIDLKHYAVPADEKYADFSGAYVTTPSSDMYLLVDRKGKGLKAYFTLLPSNIEPMVTEKLKPSKKPEIVDLYKNILEIYEDIKGFQTQQYREENTNKPEKLHEKIKKHVNWEAIKKFFGHDRVCGCKCRANKTMCRVCAESDAVIRELTFEFNNLADYMTEHCTEIQTYFWKNPNGGKKLRDSVHKIDRTMHDYFKRVKGKCEGRTCKTFTAYMDKRQSIKRTKADKERLKELMRELGISDLK